MKLFPNTELFPMAISVRSRFALASKTMLRSTFFLASNDLFFLARSAVPASSSPEAHDVEHYYRERIIRESGSFPTGKLSETLYDVLYSQTHQVLDTFPYGKGALFPFLILAYHIQHHVLLQRRQHIPS